MKAMVISDFGGLEKFQEWIMPRQEPNGDEVLVRVHASSVNPIDYKIRKAGQWTGIKPPAIIGYDVSGVIEAVGSSVRDFIPGDEVFYTGELSEQGAYAEYHVAREAIVAIKPSNLTHLEAASIPLAGATAWDALVTGTTIRVGESVLIHGGSGGVGSLAVQIAKQAGAYVFVTCSASSKEFVKTIGADFVMDYRAEEFADIVLRETGNQGVEIVLDCVGGNTIARSIKCMKPYGRMATIVNSTGDISSALRENLTIRFVFMQRARHKLDGLRVLLERERIKPIIDSVFPLNKVAAAHEKLEKGGVHGKIVLKVV